MVMVFTVFFSGYFSKYFAVDKDGLQFDKSNTGYITAVWAFFYMISAFFVGPLSKKFSVRTISFCSYILLGFSSLMFGPSKLFKFDTAEEKRLLCEKALEGCINGKLFPENECKFYFDLCEKDVR